jgi:stage III sporulation protein AH
MAKRQTIWLSTMMVLSLMLIGFYTVNNNVQQVSTSNDTAPAKTVGQKADPNKKDQAVMEASDFFVAKHLQDNQDFSKQQESLEAVIADPKASADKVEQAKNDLKALNDQQDQVEKVLDQINAEGYPDALVNTKEGKVNVTVQAQTLDNKKAVKIMNIVVKEMKVSAAKITVFSHE